MEEQVRRCEAKKHEWLEDHRLAIQDGRRIFKAAEPKRARGEDGAAVPRTLPAEECFDRCLDHLGK